MNLDHEPQSDHDGGPGHEQEPDQELRRRARLLRDMGFVAAPEPAVVTEVEAVGRDGWRITAVKPAMGTRVVFTVVGRSRDQIEEGIGRAGEEIDRLVGLLNRYDAGSPVGVLNRQGRLNGPPPELTEVMDRALRYWRLSRGRFDMTAGPLVDLLGRRDGSGHPVPPSEAERGEVLELVGSQHVALTARRVGLGRQGMGITLDGIAKGYVVDRAGRVLRRHRLRHFLINAGGDIRASGGKEGGLPWTIALRDPAGGSAYPQLLEIRNGAVATSGGYEIYFDRQRLFHHIVDTRTGDSPHGLASATVLAPTVMAADALATAAFALPPDEATAWVDRLPRCAALLIEPAGRPLPSRRWPGTAPDSGP